MKNYILTIINSLFYFIVLIIINSICLLQSTAQPQPIVKIDLMWDSTFRAVDISPDGKLISTGGVLTIIWDADTGKQINMIKDFFNVACVKFSPDGKYILAGGDGYTAKLCYVSSGEVIHTVTTALSVKPFGTGEVTAVAFSPDGKQFLAHDSYQGYLKLFDVETGNLIQDYGTTFPIGSILYLSNGKQIMSGETDRLRVIDLEKSEIVKSILGMQPTFLNGGKYLFYKEFDEHIGPPRKYTLKLIDFETGQLIYEKPLNPCIGIGPLAISPDGKYVLTEGYECNDKGEPAGTYRMLFKMDPFEKVFDSALTLDKDTNTSPSIFIQFFPDGKRFLTMSGNFVYIWDISDLTSGIPMAQEQK